VLIAIDTSTAVAGICLYDLDRSAVLDEHVWQTGICHAEQLMPQVDAALRLHGMDPAALRAVAVALGPGTFNGVRVGVTTAKLLARARGLPILGIDTLEPYAAAARGSGWLVRPLLNAARGEIATALWRAGAVLSRLEDDRIAPPDELFVEPDEPMLFTGELTEEWRAALARLGPHALIATPAQATRRPALVAQLAAERLQRGEVDDVVALAPIYLRPPHITAPRR